MHRKINSFELTRTAALALSALLLLSSCSTNTEIGNTTFCNCNSEQKISEHPYKLVSAVTERIHGNPIQNVYYNMETECTYVISYLYTNTNGEPVLTRTTIAVYDANGKIIKQNNE